MNETLLYIILGIVYLIFTALGRANKKKQRTTNQEREKEWSLEDALRDLQGLPEEQPEITSPPAPTSSSDWSGEYTAYNPEAGSSSPKAREQKHTAPKPSPAPKAGAASPSKKQPLIPKTSKTIAEQLRNQDSARTAILLGEILGKPKGMGGLPRSYFQRRG